MTRLLQSGGRRALQNASIRATEQGPAAPFAPTDIDELMVWLDADQIGLADGAAVSPWLDLSGFGNDGNIVGTPAPVLKANTLNGLPVVRFTASEGRIRGTGPFVDLTIFYVVRRWGPTAGRALTATYPGSAAFNFLVGFHTSSADWMYDNGNVTSPPGWAGPMATTPTPWRLYGADATSDPSYESRFFIDGVQTGVDWPSGQGMGGTYNLSGYSATGVEETMDCEVAELIIYGLKLGDAERIQVEDYLREKWFPAALGPVATPVIRGNGFLDQFGSSARTDTSDTFTPAANALLICVATIATQKNTAVGSSMSSTGLGAGTFTKRVTIGPGSMLAGGSGYYETTEIWVGQAGASPGSGTFSHTWTAPQSNTIRSWAFLEIASGFDPAVLTAAGATGTIATGQNPTVTMSATPAATSLVLSTCHTWDAGATAPITVPTSFTQLVDQFWTGWNNRTKLAYRNDGTNTATHQWTAAAGGNAIAAALEVPVG